MRDAFNQDLLADIGVRVSPKGQYPCHLKMQNPQRKLTTDLMLKIALSEINIKTLIPPKTINELFSIEIL